MSLSASLLLRKAFPNQHLFTPKLLIVEEISIPFAKVLNLSSKEGVVPFVWKEANVILLG